jgi:HSP20 family molecular chaperone IbpA
MHKVSSSLPFVKKHVPGEQEESSETQFPNTDVYVCDQGLVIKVELAGMRREDLGVVIEENRVKITGDRPDGCRAGRCKFYHMEINYGAFEVVIELPPEYDPALAKAAYQNGFLRIDVPKGSDPTFSEENLQGL